jgi:anti-sigma-K factor RskA
MNESIDDLLPLYALGALTDDERAEVDAYLASDPDARARLAEMRRLSDTLPYAVAPVDPPQRVKASLMNRVRADVRPRSASTSRRASASPRLADRLAAAWPRAAIAVAGLSLAIALLAGLWALSLNGEVARLKQETEILKREMSDQQELIAVLFTPDLQVMSITGTEQQPSARGRLFADPATASALLVVSGLEPLEAGKVYQFWLIRGDAPVSGGVFSLDERGGAWLRVEADTAVGSFDAMGVSIEPEGGSVQPTGDIVMLGSLS